MTETNVYELYVDGQLYGKGPIDYVHTLIDDYVVTSKMYGYGEADFTVRRASNGRLNNVVCIHGYKGADIEFCDQCAAGKSEVDGLREELAEERTMRHTLEGEALRGWAYEQALREIDTHIRSCGEPTPHIIDVIKRVLPEYRTDGKEALEHGER